MKLLVTGGAGFIGSNFIRYWLETHPNDSILNLDLLTYAGDPDSLNDVASSVGKRYELVVGDIRDQTLVMATMRRFAPESVVNFAAESHNSRAILDPTVFVRTNVLGTQILLETARSLDVGRFHQISTCEVYGDLALDSTETFDEESPYRPHTPYNASKAAADHIVRAYYKTFGYPVTISNCSNNYGPYQHPEKVISLFTINALEGRPLPVYRNSTHRREWLHVRDHCRAIDLVLTKGRAGETYNVGSGEERTIDQIADSVLEAVGASTSLKTYVEDRPGHDRRYLLDHSKIRNELGWQPETIFDSGLRRTVEWYRRNRAWWAPKSLRQASELDEARWRPGRA